MTIANNTPNSTPAAEPVQEFQLYTAARESFRTITDKGRLIVISNFKFITNNADEIAYLDAQIEAGFNLLAKGVTITAEDADPMSALRKKIIEEHEAKKAALADEVRDLGQTSDKGVGALKLGASTTATIKSMAAGSSSSAQ